MSKQKNTTETPVDELATWVTAFAQADANAKAWRTTANRAKEHITAVLEKNGAVIGTIDGRPAVRWSAVESSRFDIDKFRESYPELAEQFTVPSVSRRFTVVDKG